MEIPFKVTDSDPKSRILSSQLSSSDKQLFYWLEPGIKGAQVQ